MTRRDQITREAMTLSPEDRAYVADLLEASLAAGDSLSTEIADEWSREIDRRIAAYDRGETTAVDFETAINNMRQALAAHRSRQATQ